MFALTSMWTKLAVLISVAVGLIAIALVLALSTRRSLGVSIKLGGFETNRYREDSLLAALVTISNSSPALLAFDTTYQIQGPSGWQRPSAISNWHADASDDLSPLQPFSERIVHVPVPALMDGPWRVVVRCIGPYKGLSSFEQLRLRAYLFVFHREPERYFTSSQQSANKALHATAAPPGI